MAYLNERLVAVTELLDRTHTVADIGSDHGKLGVALLKSGMCNKVIVTDVSPGSYEKLVALVKGSHMEKEMDCRLGDGLSVLKSGEAQQAVIAGMGGRLIADILRRSEALAKELTLVLSPMQQTDDLREYLRTNGFCIEDERMVYENKKFYAVMRVVAGYETSSVPYDVYNEVGPVLFARRDPVALRRLRTKLFALKEKIDNSADQAELRQQIALLERIEDMWGADH